MLAYKQLEQSIDQLNPDISARMVHFYIKTPEDQPAPPLGWILSHQAKETMREQITDRHNCDAYRSVLEEFGSNGSTAC